MIKTAQEFGQARLAWLVLLVGLVLSGIVWQVVAGREEAEARRVFRIHLNDTLKSVSQRLDVYVNFLYGARGLFAASERVTRQEWQDFSTAAAFEKRYPGIVSLGAIRYVPRGDKALYERDVRAEVARSGVSRTPFAISPAGERDGYYPIEFIQPAPFQNTLLGVDRGADPETRRVLELSRDTGDAVMSGRLRGVPDEESRPNLLVVLPVYRSGDVPSSVEARRQLLEGFVTARIRVDEMFKELLGAGILNELFFELYDGGLASAAPQPALRDNLLHAVAGESVLYGTAAQPDLLMYQREKIELAGRNWLFFFGRDQGYGGQDRRLSFLVLGGGLVTSLLVFVVVLVLLRQRRLVMDEVNRQKSLFSQVLDALPVNVLLKDSQWRLALVNEETARTLGMTKEEALGKSDFDLFPQEIAAALRDHDEAVRAQGTLVVREETLVRDGVESFLLAGKKIIHLPDSDEPMLLGFSFDIGEIKKIEKELDQQRRFVQQVIDTDPNLIFVKDEEGRILLANQATEALYGIPREWLMRSRSGELHTNPDEAKVFDVVDRQVIESGEEVVFNQPFTRPSGEVRWFMTVKRPLPQPDGRVHVLGIAVDITEQKRSMEALHESEAKLRAIIDNTTSVIFIKDLTGRYLLINREYEIRHGVKREWLAGKTDYELFPEALANRLRANDVAVLEAGVPLEFEEVVPYGGEERTYIAVKFVMRHASGKPYAIGGIATDITERKRLEQEAQYARTNELIRSLANAVGDGLIGTSSSHQIIFANPKAQELLGMTELEMFGKKADDVVHGQTGEGAFLSDSTCPAWSKVAAGTTFHADNWTFERRDGSRFPVSLAIAPVYEKDRIVGAVLSFQDITQRKHAEQALRQMETRQKALLNNLPDMAWLKDEESRYIMVNEATASKSHMAADDIPGKTDLDLWPPDLAEIYRADDRLVMEKRLPKRVEEQFQGKDGQRIWIETIKSPICDSSGKVIGTAGIARDITERKGEQDELKHHVAELARLNAELDEFTYVASHDLQEPARKLIAFSELLRKDIGEGLPARAEKDLEFIVDAAARMQRLIRDLLSLSRAGKYSMVREMVSLDELVANVLETLDLSIRESHAVVHCDPLPEVTGDATLLTQLFQNLLSNALKFVNRHPPEVHISAEQIDGQWVFGVRDNGIGINPQYAAQIFQPFKRLHGRAQFEGSGIGLSICRKVVERHRGTLWVESREGEGAHFRFTLGKAGYGVGIAGINSGESDEAGFSEGNS
ncbi:MAG: PAS domain-containing protein [Sulfuricella sp.]|nr:PAS domain-containing protein [Sulfuricella sp.]